MQPTFDHTVLRLSSWRKHSLLASVCLLLFTQTYRKTLESASWKIQIGCSEAQTFLKMHEKRPFFDLPEGFRGSVSTQGLEMSMET